MINIATRMGKS